MYTYVHLPILQQGSLEDTVYVLLCTPMYTYLYLCTYFYLTTGESWGHSVRIIMYTYVHVFILMYIFLFNNRGVLRTCLASHTHCTYYYVHLCTLMYTCVQTSISTTSSRTFIMPHTYYVFVHLGTLVYTYAHLCTHMYSHNEWVWRTCAISLWPSVFCICRRLHTRLCTLMHTQLCTLMHIQICALEHCVYVHLRTYISSWYNKYIHIIYVYTYVHLCTPMQTYVRISMYHITGESGRPASRLCGPRCSAYAHSCTLGYVHWNTVYIYSEL